MRLVSSRWVSKVIRSTRPIRIRKRKFLVDMQQLECRDVPAFTGIGTGLIADYYSDSNLTNLAYTRLDPAVDFNWGVGSPASAIPINQFSARWSGEVQAQYTETYTFSVAAQDGYRLYVGGNLLIDAWTNQGAATKSASLAVTAGQTYDLKLEYVDHTGPANVALTWSSPSTSKETIPSSQLYPSGGWLDTDLGKPALAGSVTGTAAGYSVTGAGPLGGTADQGHFAYQYLNGDGTVVAQVNALSGGAAG